MNSDIQSGRKTVHISSCICASTRAGHSRKPNKSRRRLALGTEKRGSCNVAEVVIAGKCAVCAGTTGVNCSLGHLDRSCLVNYIRSCIRYSLYLECEIRTRS